MRQTSLTRHGPVPSVNASAGLKACSSKDNMPTGYKTKVVGGVVQKVPITVSCFVIAFLFFGLCVCVCVCVRVRMCVLACARVCACVF